MCTPKPNFVQTTALLLAVLLKLREGFTFNFGHVQEVNHSTPNTLLLEMAYHPLSGVVQLHTTTAMKRRHELSNLPTWGVHLRLVQGLVLAAHPQ